MHKTPKLKPEPFRTVLLSDGRHAVPRSINLPPAISLQFGAMYVKRHVRYAFIVSGVRIFVPPHKSWPAALRNRPSVGCASASCFAFFVLPSTPHPGRQQRMKSLVSSCLHRCPARHPAPPDLGLFLGGRRSACALPPGAPHAARRFVLLRTSECAAHSV